MEVPLEEGDDPSPQTIDPGGPRSTRSRRRRSAGSRARWLKLAAVVLSLVLVLAVAWVVTPRGGAPTPPPAMDSDGDGLLNSVETGGWLTQQGATYRTDPTKFDTDGDGLSDGEEAGTLKGSDPAPLYAGVSDPTKPDSDDDGLTDRAELHGWTTRSGATYRTDVLRPDTDGDGLFDGDEAGAPSGDGATLQYVGWSDPLRPDSDDDGMGDADEADLALDAFARDTDDDGLSDAEEVTEFETDPTNPDTDGDGLTDAYEVGHIADQGLNPLWADEKIDKWQYARDFGQGAIAGELAPGDSLAWFAGNVASGGASFIPGVGWIVGAVADVRDLVGSAIRADWVAAGFSAVALIPTAGDAAAIPAKAGKFTARVPRLAPETARFISKIDWAPDQVRGVALRSIWWNAWDPLARDSSTRSMLRLTQGPTDLNALHAARQRSVSLPPVETGKSAPSPSFFTWRAAEDYVADYFRATDAQVATQVRLPTAGCGDTCARPIRRADVVVDGVAHEVKAGHVPNSAFLRNQIEEDAWLISTGRLKGAHYHFCASEKSNRIGVASSVLELLDAKGIPYTIHLPR